MSDQSEEKRDRELEERLRERWAKTIQDEDWERLDPELSLRPPPAEGVAGESAATLVFGAMAETIISPDAAPGFDPAAPTMVNPPPFDDGSQAATIITNTPRRLPMPAASAGDESSWPARYRLEAELGRGGMGVVYRAHQANLRRDVAIKMSHPGRGSAGFKLRFLSEALVMGHLEHPNIVPVHDLGAATDGAGMLTMKLVAGTDWKTLLHPGEDADAEARKKAEDTRAHLDVLKAVCNAVEYAHSKGIVHCDLKPENVMVGQYGEVYVMDWGLAVDVREVEEKDLRASHRSSIAAPCGTPAYMPPELAEGQGDRIDERTDVYLLGAILHEIVTGLPPHTGESLVAILLSATKSLPPRFDDSVPAGLQSIIRRALACEPEDRYPSVEAFREELETFLIHRESLILSEAARRDLDDCRSEVEHIGVIYPQAWPEAQRPAIYNRYTDLISRFKQSHALWEDNEEAARGANEARRAYAALALRNGDLGIAQTQVSELPPLDSETLRLREEIAGRMEERQAAERQARRNRRALIGAGALIFFGLVIGFILVKSQQLAAIRAREEAEEQRRRAVEAGKEEARQRERAEEQRRLADRARLAAEEARAKAEEAELTIRRELAKSFVLRANSAFAARDWLRARDLFEEAQAQYRSSGRPALPVTLGLWACSRKLYTAVFSSESEGGSPTVMQPVPNSPLLLAGYQNGELRLWDLEQRRLLQTIRVGHSGAIRALAFSSDGRRVASASAGDRGSLRVWLFDDPNKRRELRGNDGGRESERGVQALAFSPDGRLLFSGNEKGGLKWWDLRYVNSFQSSDFTESITALAVAPDNRRVFVGSRIKATVFDLKDLGKSDFAVSGGARDLVLDREGDHLLTVGARTTLWNVARQPIAVRSLSFGEAGEVAALSPDGYEALVVGKRSARLWNLEQGELRALLPRSPREFLAADFSPDGEGIAAAFGAPWAFTLWRPNRAGALTITLPENSREYLGASAQGRLLLSAQKGAAVFWDGLSGRELARVDLGKVRVDALALSRDGRRFVVVQRRRLRLFDSLSGAELGALDCGSSRPGLDFSPDGRLLFVSTSKALFVLGADDARERRRWPTRSRPHKLCFTPDRPGRCLAAEGDAILLFDLDQEAPRRWPFKGPVGALGFCDEGRAFLVVSSREGRAGIAFIRYALDGEGKGQRLEGRGDTANGVRSWLSPDGEHALTLSYDGATKLWECRTGEEIVGLPGLGPAIKDLFFLEGEARLAYSRRRAYGYQFVTINAAAPRELAELEARLASAMKDKDKNTKLSEAERLVLVGQIDLLQGAPRWADAQLADGARRGAAVAPLVALEAALKAGELERAEALALALEESGPGFAPEHAVHRSLLIRALKAARASVPEPPPVPVPLQCLAAFGDERVFIGSTRGEILVYDMTTKTVVGRMYGHRRGVKKLAYLKETQQLLSLGGDGLLILWSARTGLRMRRLFPRKEGSSYATDFVVSGERVLACYGKRLVVWDMGSWRGEELSKGLETTSDALAFSAEKGMLACLSSQRNIIELRSLTGEGEPIKLAMKRGVVGMAFDAEDRLLATDRKGHLVCWDWERGAALWMTRAERSWVRDIVLDPSGRRLLFYRNGQEPRLLDLAKAALLELEGEAPRARALAWREGGDGVFVYTMNDRLVTTKLAEER